MSFRHLSAKKSHSDIPLQKNVVQTFPPPTKKNVIQTSFYKKKKKKKEKKKEKEN